MEIITILYNLVSLVALCMLSGFVDARFSRKAIDGRIYRGILFGLIAITGMMFPYHFSEGIIFDGRSIIISIGTLFFGPVSGSIATGLAMIYRISLGGAGLFMGLAVILGSFLIGWIFYSQRQKERYRINMMNLYWVGLLVHLEMWAALSLIPGIFSNEYYLVLSLTIVGIYPIITVFVGKVLLYQENFRKTIEKVSFDESLHRATLYSIKDGVITTDLKGNIRHMNPIAEALTGYSGDTSKGLPLKDIFRLVDESTSEYLPNPLEGLMRKDHPAACSKKDWLLPKNGTRVCISHTESPIVDENNRYIGMVLVFRDETTEQKHKQEIEETFRLFSSAFINSPMAMSINAFDDGRYHDVNEVFLKETGYAREELIGKNAREVTIFNDPEELRTLVRHLNEEGSVYGMPFVSKTKMGRTRDCLISSSVIALDGKKYILSSIIDVTTKHNMEQALIQSETRFSDLFRKHSAVKVLVDPATSAITDANEAAVKFYGWTKTELLGKRITDIIQLPSSERLKETDRKKKQ